MSDTSLSKRPVLIALSVTSLIAVLGIGSYFYYQQKHTKTHKNTQKHIITPKQTFINGVKTPTTAEVLTVLFGVKTTAAKVANAPDQLSSFWFEQSFSQHNDKFNAVFIKTQNVDPETKALFNSHVDGANISIVVYKQAGKEWELFAKQTNVGSLGSWGDVPETKNVPTLQLSPDNIAFLIESGSSGQGYTEEGRGIFSFNFKTKAWKDLGFIQTGGDNAGACDDKPQPADSVLSACWSFTGEITLAKTGKNPDYPDLLVVEKGTTSDDNNKIIPVKNRLYVFNGEQYLEPGAESR